jgi:hypothetical protein
VPFLAFKVLGFWTSGRKNRLVHIRRDSIIVVKENKADFVFADQIMFPVL